MSAERSVEKPEAAIEHPAVIFAREVRASVVLPSPAHRDHVRRMDAETDVTKVWALYGPQKEF